MLTRRATAVTDPWRAGRIPSVPRLVECAAPGVNRATVEGKKNRVRRAARLEPRGVPTCSHCGQALLGPGVARAEPRPGAVLALTCPLPMDAFGVGPGDFPCTTDDCAPTLRNCDPLPCNLQESCDEPTAQ